MDYRVDLLHGERCMRIYATVDDLLFWVKKEGSTVL